MIVQTGPMPLTSWPAASRRRSPRSTASPTASAWGTVKETVALMLIPRAVTSSIAAIPADVAGILTMMFGARPSKCTACSTSRVGVAPQPGSVWIERRPSRPPWPNAGSSSAAAATDSSSTASQPSSDSVAVRVGRRQLGEPRPPARCVGAQRGERDDGIRGGAHGAPADRRRQLRRGRRSRSTAGSVSCASS